MDLAGSIPSVPDTSPFPGGAVWFIGDSAGPPRGSAPRGTPAEESAAERYVLVVDDEAETLDAVVEIFEGEGVSVLRAGNGREALDLLDAGWRPSLILLDLKMPVMDGWEFCRLVAEDDDVSSIPIAIVTATASFSNLPERRKDAGFFPKPVDFDRLLKAVRHYCG